MVSPNSESCQENRLHSFMSLCISSIRDSNNEFPASLPEFDLATISNRYTKPTPLFMGKFVTDADVIQREKVDGKCNVIPSNTDFADAQNQPVKRLVTEKVLPVVMLSGEAKFVQYKTDAESDILSLHPQKIIFPIHKFRKKGDAYRFLLSLKKPFAVSTPTYEEEHAKDVNVQLENADKLCLYKMGPGVVAFRVVISTLHSAGMRHTVDNDWNLLWGKRISATDWKRSNIYQKINHFPGSRNVGRKDLLHWNLAKFRQRFPTEFNFTPATFVLPQESRDFEAYTSAQEKHTFIVKPVASSCGKGIYLTESISLPWKHKSSLIQQYIPSPLLIDGRKFDLRVYVAVTGFNPLRAYVFEDGLVRFAPEKYPGDSNELTSIHKHVTNYSINKHCSPSGVEIKWGFEKLKSWMLDTFPDGEGRWEQFNDDLEAVVVKTLIAAEPEIEKHRKVFVAHDERAQGCFELYGFDLLLDQSFKLFLIEVNIMPSLATESDVDIDVKCKLLANLLRLVGVAIYDRGEQNQEYSTSLQEVQDAENFIEEIIVAKNFEKLLHKNKKAKFLIEMLVASEAEVSRKGDFRQVFPTASSLERYGHLLDDRMLLTQFLMCWEEYKSKFLISC